MKLHKFMKWMCISFIGICCYTSVLGQSREMKITKTFDDISLGLALVELRQEYGLIFHYPEHALEGKWLFQKRIRRQPLDIAMKILLAGTGLEHRVIDEKTVLIHQEEVIAEVATPPKDWKPEKQNFTLKGLIHDRISGETLPNATIRIKGSENGAITNLDGYFTLFNVPTDTSP